MGNLYLLQKKINNLVSKIFYPILEIQKWAVTSYKHLCTRGIISFHYICKNCCNICSKLTIYASNGKSELKMESLEQDFAQIIRKNKGTIYTVCYMFSKNEDEVADLFQEILINLWNGFKNFRGESTPGTWIYRVSLNTCISLNRKKKRRGDSVPLEMDINLFDNSGEDIKQIQMLHQRISQLGPFDRAIILLWLENMSYDEIGAIVGISAKNVSVRLFRIKEQLKKMSNQ